MMSHALGTDATRGTDLVQPSMSPRQRRAEPQRGHEDVDRSRPSERSFLVAQVGARLGVDAARTRVSVERADGRGWGRAAPSEVRLGLTGTDVADRALVAHELAHVVQYANRGQGIAPDVTRAEAEAAGLAHASRAGRPLWVPRTALPDGHVAADSGASGVAIDAGPRVVAPSRQQAEILIAQYTNWGNLDEDGLGDDLARRLPGDSALVQQVFTALSWTDRDDVAFAMCVAAADDSIKRIVQDAAGLGVLLRAVKELQSGWTTDAEAGQMRRVLRLIADTATPHVPGPAGETIEIKVITFRWGNPILDWLGEHIASLVTSGRGRYGPGAKGHTAVVVGDLVYSFDEAGWEVGESEKEYMCRNQTRDAHVQVLLLPLEDARKIQRHLNDAANRGLYFVGGEVCTDASADALSEGLGRLDSRSNPQNFVHVLDATGRVARSYDVPRGHRDECGP